MLPVYVCELCGSRYETGDSTLCSRCPLHSGCGLMCCPNCGYSTAASRGHKKLPGWKSPNPLHSSERSEKTGRTLVGCPAGMETSVRGFSAKMPDGSKLFLLGRGIRPGKSVRILQRSPEMVIQVDHLQIAIEKELAAWIAVD